MDNNPSSVSPGHDTEKVLPDQHIVTPTQAQQSENVVAPTQITSSPEQPVADKRFSFLKLLLYFLIGFFLTPIGLIIGLIWISLKVEEGKKQRIIALSLGTVVGLVIGIAIGLLISKSVSQQAIQLGNCLEKNIVAMENSIAVATQERWGAERICSRAKVFTEDLQECYTQAESDTQVPYKLVEAKAIEGNPNLFTLERAINLHNSQCSDFPHLLIK